MATPSDPAPKRGRGDGACHPFYVDTNCVGADPRYAVYTNAAVAAARAAAAWAEEIHHTRAFDEEGICHQLVWVRTLGVRPASEAEALTELDWIDERVTAWILHLSSTKPKGYEELIGAFKSARTISYTVRTQLLPSIRPHDATSD